MTNARLIAAAIDANTKAPSALNQTVATISAFYETSCSDSVNWKVAVDEIVQAIKSRPE